MPIPIGGGAAPRPVKIEPADFHRVAQRFVAASTTVHQVLPALFRVLSGFRGPAGVDRSARRFDAAYRPAVDSLVDGVHRTVNLLVDIGVGIDTAAYNHFAADAAATPNGAPARPWTPVDPGLVLPQSLSTPSLVGSPTAVLPPPLQDLVPMGHVDDLGTVAQAFRAADDTIVDTTTELHNALESLFADNESADLDALSEFWDHVGILAALHRACDQIATSVQDYANWTIDAQNQILDAVGDILRNAALGALAGILIGLFTDGVGALGALLEAADEVGEGGALVAAVGAAVAAVDGQLAAIGVAAGGVVGAMSAAISATPNPGIDPTEPQSVSDTQEQQAAEDVANRAQPVDGPHTEPSGTYDPNATPNGPPTRISPNEAPENVTALTRDNESAQILARNGYDVEQNPDLPGGKNPDYLIEGRIFDNYAPTTGNARNIAQRIGDKVNDDQADRIVLNLSDSSVNVDAMRAQLRDWPIAGLQEVKVVDAQGDVLDLYP
jgi:hypothetical protein